MAGGYIIDPQTGQAGVQTASGGFLPLPMSPAQLAAAGLPGPPGLPPPPDAGPDQRLAFNSPAYESPLGGRQVDQGDVADFPAGAPLQPGTPEFRAHHVQLMADQARMREETDRQAALDRRKNFEGEQAARSYASKKAENDAAAFAGRSLPNPGLQAPPASALARENPPSPGAARVAPPSPIDAKTLAIPGAAGQSAAPGEADNGETAIRDQLMAEAMKGRGGGGGPRGLGIAGETRKFSTFENPGGDPAKTAAAQEALGASDKYGEELAKSLAGRQQQAYEAQQAEYAARSGQLAAQQQRFEQQQSMLQDYQAKRDSLMQEAAQLKTPQMEDYWKSKGTFATIATALSMVAGGALAGLRGGPNMGLEMSNQEIDRWIASQREAYQRAQGRVTDADNQFAKMVQAFGSENLATAHLREQAWTVRDNMLKSYAEKIGTPTALENYNQAMLQTEAQRAALQAQAAQGAQVEIEQKLSMQGGGGGGGKTFRQALAETAGGLKDYREIVGGGQKEPTRAIDSEKTNSLAAALETVQAADEIKGHVQALGYADSDTDDPRSGPIDYVTKNIPGTETRKRGQDLEQATFSLARGAQQFLGKSDNDATLAEKQARGLGGSGRERIQAAERLKQKAISKAKIELSAMTPDQRNAFIQALAPDQRALVQGIFTTDNRPAGSAQEVR